MQPRDPARPAAGTLAVRIEGEAAHDGRLPLAELARVANGLQGQLEHYGA